jgi:hypothetical protein
LVSATALLSRAGAPAEADAGHGLVLGERWPEFLKIGASFSRQ